MINTYTSYSLITRNIEKSIDRVELQPMVKRDAEYYRANIGKVKTIEEFVGNDRLFRFAMKAFGLEDMTYAKAFMVKALKEGVSSPDSFANKLTDKRYAEFVAAFNFEKHGANATTYNVATHDIPTNFQTQAAIVSLQNGFDYVETEVGNYISNIGNVTSIDDLMADTRLLKVALGAFGLDPAKETPERIRQMLEGGVTDPNSPANKLVDKRYANFVAAFNFVEYGAATTTRSQVLKTVPANFVANTGLQTMKPTAEFTKSESDYYKANIGKVTSIDGLLKDQRLLRAAMAAHGLSADNEDPKVIRQMLEGGVTNPNSPANKLTDKSYAAFVSAFNFVEHGTATTQRDAVQKDTLNLYTQKSELGLVKLNPDYMASETAYYRANVVKLTSVDDFVADKRLMSYALYSFGFDAATADPDMVREMLEGGITDPNSPANQQTDKRFQAFVGAFNFAEHGAAATTRTDAQQPTIDKYMRQTLEENAGKDNEGVRLALYFQRKAADITNFYEVLADPALARVVRTALSLPDSFASANIDKQVALFENKLNIEDLQDPKKLEKFLQRFTSLWEISNPSGPQVPSVSVLFAQPVEYGISTNTLFAIQSLRR